MRARGSRGPVFSTGNGLGKERQQLARDGSPWACLQGGDARPYSIGSWWTTVSPTGGHTIDLEVGNEGKEIPSVEWRENVEGNREAIADREKSDETAQGGQIECCGAWLRWNSRVKRGQSRTSYKRFPTVSLDSWNWEPGTGTGFFDGKRAGKRNRRLEGFLSFDPTASDESARHLPSAGPDSLPTPASSFAVPADTPCDCTRARWGHAPRGPTDAR